MRVVLDLNVFISANFFSGEDAPPVRIVQAAFNKHFVTLHTPDYLADLLEVFSKEKFAARLASIGQTPRSIVDYITELGESVVSADVPSSDVRDPDDAVILACAVGGSADYIVSGDQDLLVLKTYRDIPILSPAEFLQALNTPSDTTNHE